jgi:type IV pilus assembly protein PilC
VPKFRYVAVDAAGAQVKGAFDAQSEAALRNDLLRQNLVVKSVKLKKSLGQLEITPQKVPLSEIMHFSRQMAAFVRSGIPIMDGIDVIADGTNNKRFRQILFSVNEQIRQGVPFADAIAEHNDILPPYYLGIVRSAELTGRLDVALEQLSGYIERELEAKSKIKSALTYPLVVLAMSIVTIAILTIWVLPKFVDFFDSLDAQLPLSTRMLLNFARFAKDFWFVFPLTFLGLAAAGYCLQKTRGGNRLRDRVLLRMPVIGDVVLYSVVERICRVLGAMSQAGVPIPEGMRAAVSASRNTVFEEKLQPAQEAILEGAGLAEPIAQTELFPRAAVQMMRVGETTGTLDRQLENAADYYSTELDYKLKRLTTLFEPIVIVIMGLVVGFVAVALVQAMYGIYHSPAINNL